MSCVMCHVSCVMCQVSVINGAYTPSSLQKPRLFEWDDVQYDDRTVLYQVFHVLITMALLSSSKCYLLQRPCPTGWDAVPGCSEGPEALHCCRDTSTG